MDYYEIVIMLVREKDSPKTIRYFIGSCCYKNPWGFFSYQRSAFEGSKVYVTQQDLENKMFKPRGDIIIPINCSVQKPEDDSVANLTYRFQEKVFRDDCLEAVCDLWQSETKERVWRGECFSGRSF